MKNVTITLDEETATWARIYAARKNLSLSRYVGELLRDRMHESREYEEAMRAFWKGFGQTGSFVAPTTRICRQRRYISIR